MNEKYLKEKLRQIEGEVAIVAGVSSLSALMVGKVTDTSIKARDDGYRNIEKIVHQIIKRLSLNKK